MDATTTTTIENDDVVPTTTTTSLHEQLRTLASAHNASKTILKARNLVEFEEKENNDDGLLLFHRFARAVCRASCVPRKEVLEAWAMALYVHKRFPHLQRFADLACGHGLVSWALLLLASSDTATTTTNNNNNTTPTALSVVCIDIRMPGSAERVAEVFLKEWPEFEDRWDYVEGSVDAIQPASSTLLLGVHACGPLSDRIIQLAIRGQAPLALVPCCHSKKCLTDSQRADPSSWTGNLADFLDGHRIQELETAGFDIKEDFLPEEITPKNRLILAYPKGAPIDTTNPDTIVPVIANMLKPYQMPKIAIPVADTPKAKAILRSLAGKAAALERKKSPSVKISMSLHLPPERELKREQLQAWLDDDSAARQYGDIRVEYVDDKPFVDPETGRRTRTFKLTYPRGMSKQDAKQVHIGFCHQMPTVFPGVEARQLPK
jgi:hypothetical protein